MKFLMKPYNTFNNKNNQKDLFFVSFQGLRKGLPWGLTRAMLPILETGKFKDKNLVYYVSISDKYNGKVNIKEVSVIYNLFNKILLVLNRIILKLGSHKIRLIQEIMFDFFLSLKITKGCTIVSSAYLYKTNKKNKRLGGKNILFISNPDDYFLYKLLINEQKDHNVKFIDAYTYRKRVAFSLKSTRSFDKIICISSSVFDSFKSRIPASKLNSAFYELIPNKFKFSCIDVNKHEKLTFVYIGHSVWLKGITYLLEAWQKIDSSAAQLLIAGSINPQLNDYIKLHFNNLKNISYVGHLNNPNEFYRKAHVFISPSLMDAHPATISEAMYCGLPVIVSDGCGSKELVENNVNGFIVPSRDSESIKNKIEWFMKNTNSIEIMGKNAYNTILIRSKNNQNEEVANQIMTIIDNQI
jgi:glycosyltransferase involved in cell wall biosynthesis